MIRITRAFLLAVACVLVLVTPVLAYLYRAPVAITENASTSYDMLGVLWDQNNTWLANNGFMASTANDTRVQTLGGLNRPWLVADNKTLTAIPVPADSQTNLYFVTGESAVSAMDIIVGSGGYITVIDDSTLELGDNFTIDIPGYIDTDNGTAKRLVYKEGAIAVSVNSTISGRIDVEMYASRETYTTNDDGVANIYDVNWRGQTFTTSSKQIATGVRIKAFRSGSPGTLTLGLRAVSGGLPTGTDLISGTINANTFTAVSPGDWYDISFSSNYTISPDTTYAMVLRATSGDGANYVSWRVDASAPTYAGGNLVASGDSGASWAAFAGQDAMFTVLGNYQSTLSATGVSSGVHQVDLTTDRNVLYIDGSADSYIDSGAIYNNQQKLWLSFFFTPESNFTVGSPNNMVLFAKRIDGSDLIYIYMLAADGRLYANQVSGGASAWTLNGQDGAGVDITSWSAGQWYHVLLSTSNTAGQRLRINNGVADTSSNLTVNTPNGGNFIIGNLFAGYSGNFQGYIANFSTGDDDLTQGEETALYNQSVPSDAVDYWRVNEGSGVTVISYGTAANNGTVPVASADWRTWGGLETSLLVDSIEEGNDYLFPGGVYANSNNYTLIQNDVVPYADSISFTVNGTQQLLYQPNAIVQGTTLPDRVGSNDGVITWGSNPSGVGVTLGSMVSSGQPSIGATSDTSTSDLLPVVGGTDWNPVPSVSAALLANPMRPLVTAVSDNTTLSEYQVWVWFGIIFVIFVTALVGSKVRGHHLITGVAASGAIILMVVWTVFPLLSLLVVVIAIWGGLVSERSPSL